MSKETGKQKVQRAYTLLDKTDKMITEATMQLINLRKNIARGSISTTGTVDELTRIEETLDAWTKGAKNVE